MDQNSNVSVFEKFKKDIDCKHNQNQILMRQNRVFSQQIKQKFDLYLDDVNREENSEEDELAETRGRSITLA